MLLKDQLSNELVMSVGFNNLKYLGQFLCPGRPLVTEVTISPSALNLVEYLHDNFCPTVTHIHSDLGPLRRPVGHNNRLTLPPVKKIFPLKYSTKFTKYDIRNGHQTTNL
jgi:hypothetical protein